MNNPDIATSIAVSLERIADSLQTIASYAELLRREHTGEREFEVGGYVLSSTSQGDHCVHLYSTHPGLEYKVATVYQEQFGILPFAPGAKGEKMFQGSAPKRLVAAQQGFLNSVEPFCVLLRNVSHDPEQPRYRVSTVLPLPSNGQPSPATPGPTPSPALAPEDEFEQLPVHPQSTKTAWRSWRSPEEAMSWIEGQGVFPNQQAVEAFYTTERASYLEQHPNARAPEFFKHLYNMVLDMITEGGK